MPPRTRRNALTFREGGWDTHGFNNTRMFPIIEKYHLPITGQTLPTLLTDLADRGLLDKTVVVWMGEFCRTPKFDADGGRDHYSDGWLCGFSGGGVVPCGSPALP